MSYMKLDTDRHGVYTLNESKSRDFITALMADAHMMNGLQEAVEGHIGFDYGYLGDLSRVELLFVWIDSGNYNMQQNFGVTA